MAERDPRRRATTETLVRLVRDAATPDLRTEIAEGDSQAAAGDDRKHLAALNDLIDTYDCRLTRQSDNSWYPREPIELISYASDGHSRTSQVVCNALLMIAELEDDAQGHMAFRWFKTPGEAWFRALPDGFRDPLLDGFEALHADMSELEWQFWQRETVMQRLRDKVKTVARRVLGAKDTGDG
ncbi:hypothetical protein [Roseovarius aestuariivivens]|uniref:hypothetical protein n=1 Tax=Roseovarius aestuariivivens TaxID=1888910 RepID=UPI001081E9B8|nr:hypothetical protein [Roseovarius aestuariivivens]